MSSPLVSVFRRLSGGYIPFKVAAASVDEHGDEENGIEVWDERGGAGNSAPAETHDPVCDIVLRQGLISMLCEEQRRD